MRDRRSSLGARRGAHHPRTSHKLIHPRPHPDDPPVTPAHPEASRSGDADRTGTGGGKALAVVHDNSRIPALRRLYMTATPRLWQLDDGQEPGGAGELVASMEDDTDGPFGALLHAHAVMTGRISSHASSGRSLRYG